MTKIKSTNLDATVITFVNNTVSTEVANVVPSAVSGAVSSAVAGLPAAGNASPRISNVQIVDGNYNLIDDTAVSIDGGNVKIIGTGFVSGCSVLINNTLATSVSFVSNTEVIARLPATSAGTYVVYLLNPDGGVAIRVNAVSFSASPNWSTSTTLPTGANDTPISIQLSASSNSNITYALQSGSVLPSGLTLSSWGLLSGTVTGLSVDTTYNFTVVATDQESQDTPRAFSIFISAADINFRNVSLLISSANTGNTFVTDYSVNSLTITAADGARPNGFNPYTPGYYSVFFDGTGDYINTTVPGSLGSGDFTVEFWVFCTGSTSNNGIFHLSSTLLPGAVGGLALAFGSGASGWYFYWGSASNATITSLGSPTANLWYHIVISRSVTTTRVYINGVEATSVSDSFNYTFTALAIGGYYSTAYLMTGYISNFRIVAGTALYTTAFTPPTAPLTSITGTGLLACRSNQIIDAGPGSLTLTRNGEIRVDGFVPFVPSSSFSTYGSGYFDGSGDFLSPPSNSVLAFGTNAYTVEFWIYFPSYQNTDMRIVDVGTTANSWGVVISNNGTISVARWGAANVLTSSASFILRQWNHVAVVRTSTATNGLSIYFNGVSVGTGTDANNWTVVTTPRINGAAGQTQDFIGYLSGLRIVNGTAVYTANFGTSSALPTAVANTSLLTLLNNQPNNNSMFLDSSGNNFIITRNGNTTQGSFTPYAGTWSVYFDGNGDHLSIAHNTALNLSSGNFTIEAWVWWTGTNSSATIIDKGGTFGSTYPSYDISMNGSGFVKLELGSGSGTNAVQAFTSNTSFPTNQWVHIAAVKNGTTVTLFQNGVSVASATQTVTMGDGGQAVIVGYQTGQPTANHWNGYISNVRIVKGTAVYTANFTPPAAPLTPIAGTSLLTCADNRFIDTAFNFTVTRNGDARINKFSPFAPQMQQTPLSYSVLFDGTDDNLNIPASSAFAITTSTTPFTIECWINPSAAGSCIFTDSYTGAGDPIPICLSLGGGTDVSVINGLTPSFGWYNGSAWTTAAGSTTALTIGQWAHLAAVFTGSTSRIYINGTDVTRTSSPTPSTTWGVTGSNGSQWFIGRRWDTAGNNFFAGYISNFRFVRGTAVYTENFTVPTGPLTAISNTSLLTCQNTTIRDNSSNNFTITGSASLLSINPFGYTNPSVTAYSPDTYGGSMYFDGTGDWLAGPSGNSAFAMGTSDFTCEMWLYLGAKANGTHFFNVGDGSGTTWIVGLNNTPVFEFYAAGASRITGTTNPALNTWYHVAVSRVSGTTRLYINGVQEGSNYTDSNNYTVSAGYPLIGSRPAQGTLMTGYMSDLRVIKGTAVYRTPFVPSTLPLTSVPGTVLLLNGNRAAIYDNSMCNLLETIGNSVSVTNFKKYGNSSLFFDGTGDYMYSQLNPNFAFGTGDFTIEAWIYTTSSATQRIVSLGTGNNGEFVLVNSGSNVWLDWFDGTVDIGSNTTFVTQNAWVHVAVTRSSSTVRVFINGTVSGTPTTSTRSYGSVIAYIGTYGANNSLNNFAGYMSDIRITQGVARYTANFTAPNNLFANK